MSEPDWQRTLEQVEQSVAECLAALDRYETANAAVLTPSDAARTPTRGAPATTDSWDSRLAAVRGASADVERLLIEQEVEWGRWRESFTAWRSRIEHLPGVGTPSHAEDSHEQGGSHPSSGRQVEPLRRD